METKLNYGTVSTPYWPEVWLVGCGPSARAFDFARLNGKRVCAINDLAIRLTADRKQYAFESLSVFSLDSTWVAKNRDFLSAFDGEKHVGIPLETFPECGDIPGVIYLQWRHSLGLSEDPGVLCTGCNSGYGALNLAYLKRAERINLIGYDMYPDENHPAFSFWVQLFSTTTPQLARRGVTVLNHNPASAINAFAKVTA